MLEALLGAAAERFDVHWVGVGYDGEELSVGPLRVYPVRPGGGDFFGAYRARELADRLAPRVVFVLHDYWHLGRYARLLRPACGPQTRLVAYFPLDGRLPEPALVAPLAGWDLLVTYTEGARQDLAAAGAALVARGELPRFPTTAVLAHGVDTECFRPTPELLAAGFAAGGRVAAKRLVFPRLADPERSFVVLNPARPCDRKRLDLTLEAFALFARDKPAGVRLCLHQAISTPELRDEMVGRATGLGIMDRLELDPLGPGRLDDAELARLYAASDVGLSTSMGEGWGLTTLEHAATGAAQVVPDHSALGELWRGAAELVEPARRYVPAFSPLEMAEVAPAAVAAALERLYSDPERLRATAAACHAVAMQPRLSWAQVGSTFVDLLQR